MSEHKSVDTTADILTIGSAFANVGVVGPTDITYDFRSIWVTFQRKGTHCYPDAPEDVAYLRVPHRHLFKFRVEISVTHNEREIEFHQFLNWLESLYDGGTLNMDSKSCETIASELLGTIHGRYPDRVIFIEVSEDGECGAVLRSYHHNPTRY